MENLEGTSQDMCDFPMIAERRIRTRILSNQSLHESAEHPPELTRKLNFFFFTFLSREGGPTITYTRARACASMLFLNFLLEDFSLFSTRRDDYITTELQSYVLGIRSP